MDFYNYILNTLPHRNDQEKVGVGTALAALFGHPHPGEPEEEENPSGLHDVLDRFHEAGLGDAARSWVGTGSNQQVSPEDVHRALGDDKVRQLSHQSGMSTQQLLPLLAQYLPMIIDRLTPNGQLPQRGGLLGALGGLLGRR
jgi:uncharacterized protein YidB (DUF937 family)